MNHSISFTLALHDLPDDLVLFPKETDLATDCVLGPQK